MDTTDETEAQKRFHLAIKRAKREGVKVDDYFVNSKERVALAYVRCFGLAISTVAVVYGPKWIIDLKIQCLREHLDVIVPEQLIYWLCALGFVSILAFGFDLVDPRALTKIWDKDHGEDDLELPDRPYDRRRSIDHFSHYSLKDSQELFEDQREKLEIEDVSEGTDGSV